MLALSVSKCRHRCQPFGRFFLNLRRKPVKLCRLAAMLEARQSFGVENKRRLRGCWRSRPPRAGCLIRTLNGSNGQKINTSSLCVKTSLNPIAIHLAKIDWTLFGTLTWEKDSATTSSPRAEQIRQEDFLRLIGHACGRLRLRQRNLAIYGKSEWGAGMRGHYNFLVARHGTKNKTPEKMAEIMHDYWLRNHGISKIKPFDANRHWKGVKYQSKQEFDASGNPLLHSEYRSKALMSLLRKNAEADSAL